jgi:hypothetical protein
VLLSAAAWLIRTALTEKLAREAEVFKARLKANADIEIEQLKGSLEKAAFEHQVRFSKLHEKRAEVIAELYKRLVDVFWNSQRFVLTSENSPQPGQREEYAKADHHVREFVSFFEVHQIYLPTRACALVDKFVAPLRKAVASAGVYGRIEYPTERTRLEIQHAFTKAYQAFDTDIPAAKGALEAEFRAMLGVAQDNGTDRQNRDQS